jgi:hypothetical protein
MTKGNLRELGENLGCSLAIALSTDRFMLCDDPL